MAWTIEWAVGTAWTASVVPNGAALAGEFLWILGLGTEGTLFGFVGFGKDGKDTGFLVRPLTVGGLCTEMNSTLPDGWLVTKVPGWLWRSWGCEDTATGTCKITGKDCKEIVGWGFPLGTWVEATTVAVLGAGRTDVAVREPEVTGGCNLGWLLTTVGGVTRLVEGTVKKKRERSFSLNSYLYQLR